MGEGQEKLYGALVAKLRADVGVGSLVVLTNHATTSPEAYRIFRDRPIKKEELHPALGVQVFQSIPLMFDGPSQVQQARVYFKAYAHQELTSIRIADRVDLLLHARAEDGVRGTNRGWYNFSNADISNRRTMWKGRRLSDFDGETSVWMTLVEADVIWVDEPCPTPP